MFDTLCASDNDDTRKLCACILSMPVGLVGDLVFEVSLKHNEADSCAAGVHEAVATAEYHPVVLSRSVC